MVDARHDIVVVGKHQMSLLQVKVKEEDLGLESQEEGKESEQSMVFIDHSIRHFIL